MEILFYIMIVLFALDIIIGFVNGFIEGKHASEFNKRLWWLEEQYYKGLTDSVFPEFKENHENENI